MVKTAVEVDPRLIAFVLPSIPESVRIARLHVRAALGFHGLAEYVEDAEIITSELVTNAVQHVRIDGFGTVGVTLARAWNPPAVTVVVSDSSPDGPVQRDALAGSERGRGLQIVEALSAHWGWRPQVGGKVIYAVLAREARPVMADIPDLPMPHHIDADYSPQCIKLAQALRDRIESGEYRHGDTFPAADLAHEYNVSIRITYSALAVLTANRYISRPGSLTSYRVTWQAET
jgi:anti-sigma regulatory factor (Ser/Thr protein kinase)